MSVVSHKLGPGQLTFGEPGSTREFSTSITKAEVTPNVEDGDEIHTLDGKSVVDDGKTSWTIEGEVLQAYDAESLIKWCFDNAGEHLPMTYVANREAALKVKGKAIITPIKYGGEVKSRNTSSFTFKLTDVTFTTED